MQFQSFKEILPHWELSDSFTVIEAAALIAGVEPTSIDESLEWFRDKQSGFTVSDGIHEFTAALNILLNAIRSGSLKADDNTGHLKVISVERSDLVEWISSKGKRFRPAFFFPDDQDSEGFTTDPKAAHRLRQLEADNARLVEQVAELERRLAEATAAAQQAPQQDAPQPDAKAPGGRWPWGVHHTENLGHLEAAGLRHWQWFDPSDHTTAPTNETVIGWLKSEHKVSDNLARAMATILRADKLPHGPRR